MDLEKHSSTEYIAENCQEKKKYAKLTEELKKIFIRKIVIDNLSIKQASELLRINYSSAKAIISAHRKESTLYKKPSVKRNAPMCGYLSVDEASPSLCVQEISSSVGGLYVSTYMCHKKNKLIKKNTIIQGPTRMVEY